jgi:hypothetical protein
MKAIIAVAPSMLTSAFHMLTSGKLAKRLVRRLEDLGLKVSVEKAA